MSLWGAVRPIVRDFLSTIVFVSLVWISDDIVLATAFGVGVGILQTIWMLARSKPIAMLQWLSLGLVLVLGSTTILTHNGIFFKLKSSIIALVLAAVLMRRRWLEPYLPPIIVRCLDAFTIARAARTWAILMVAIALANAVVAFTCSNRQWAFFIVSVPALSYIVTLALQYRKLRSYFVAPKDAREAGD